MHIDDPDDRGDDFRAIAALAEAFTAMVTVLTDRHTLALELETLVSFGQQTMPRTQHTGLLFLESGVARTVAATSDLPERLDGLRARLGEGPALDVLETNDMVISGDVAGDPRWPHFGPQALDQLGVRSLACYRLHLGPGHRAALIFISDWPFAFDEVAVSVGAILAAYCSLILLTERILHDEVTARRASEVHREIGVAVGILLSDDHVSTDQAYRRLYDASRRLATSVPELARHVITHRTLPDIGNAGPGPGPGGREERPES